MASVALVPKDTGPIPSTFMVSSARGIASPTASNGSDVPGTETATVVPGPPPVVSVPIVVGVIGAEGSAGHGGARGRRHGGARGRWFR